jgi:prepilin-type N-terminal cleavage/methylation domain-containing protein
MATKSAFTLIELIVVIALMALIAAFSIPTYQLLLAQAQLSGATSDVINFLILTEQQTVTQQKIYGVTLTVGATSIPQFLYNPSNGAKTQQTPFSLAANTDIGAVSFSSQSDVRFSTSAAPSTSGSFDIYDTSRYVHKTITVAPSGDISANQPETPGV